LVNEIISKRKSIRKYKVGAEVSDEQIKELLEAAMLAPSACGLRPWEFIVVKNREYLDKIMKFDAHAGMLKTASCAILVCINPDVQKGFAGDGMWQHDGGAATENILLQAASMGLGTCWCGLHPNEKYIDGMRKLFDLGENIVPFCVIAVGIPDEEWGSRGHYEEKKVRWFR